MLNGFNPFKDEDHAVMKERIINADYKSTSKVSGECNDLLSQLLEPDPSKRIMFSSIKTQELIDIIPFDHPWLASAPDSMQVFKNDAIVRIIKETVYRDVYHNNKDKGGNVEQDIEKLDYTLRYLESTLDARFKNITEKSLLLSPYNTTAEKPFKVIPFH